MIQPDVHNLFSVSYFYLLHFVPLSSTEFNFFSKAFIINIKHNKQTSNVSGRLRLFLCYEPSYRLESNLLCLLGGKQTEHFSAASVTGSKFYILRGRVSEDEVQGMDERREGRKRRITAD